MTVAELIAALSQFDPTMKVVVAGFDEWGFDDIVKPFIVHISTDDAVPAHYSYSMGGENAVMINFCNPYREEGISSQRAAGKVWPTPPYQPSETELGRVRDVLASGQLNGKDLLPDQRKSLELFLARSEGAGGQL